MHITDEMIRAGMNAVRGVYLEAETVRAVFEAMSAVERAAPRNPDPSRFFRFEDIVAGMPPPAFARLGFHRLKDVVWTVDDRPPNHRPPDHP